MSRGRPLPRAPRRQALVLGAGLGASLLGVPAPAAAWAPDEAVQELVPPGAGPQTFRTEFFGLNIHGALDPRHWPTIPFGAWRIWDTRTNWRDVSPRPGQWDFAKLDALVEQGRRAKVRILLVLGMTPAWASSRPAERCAYGPGCAAPPLILADWVDYVRRVVQRYAGKVHEYQIWNEANHSDYWSGSLEELVRMIGMAREQIRHIDPKAVIVAPSGVGLDRRVEWVGALLSAGAGPLVDVASYHLYHGGAAPEITLRPLLQLLHAKREAGYASKPIWNTETGYWIEPERTGGLSFSAQERLDRIDRATASRHLPRMLLLARALGFDRFYWYAWDNIKLGFVEHDTLELRPHARVLGAFSTLFRGATIQRCTRQATGVWHCALTMGDGRRAVAYWTERGEQAAGIEPATVRVLSRFDEYGLTPIPLGTTTDMLRARPFVTVAHLKD